MPTPLIQLEPNATAPILRYDIPEPTSYSGFNLIELSFPDDIFTDSVKEEAEKPIENDLASETSESLRNRLATYFGSGLGGAALGLRSGVGIRHLQPQPNPPAEPPDGLPRGSFFAADIENLVGRIKEGERIVEDNNVNGDTNVDTVPVPEVLEPRLYLVETIQMTSFLGDYGAGRVVKTFTLLPGESTRISVKTYRQTESTAKRGSSILDSVSREAADDLQSLLQSEQSDQRGYEKSREYYADVKAKASWGWGGASVAAGKKGATNATRQEAVKNVSSATKSHSSKASAKREVRVETSFEVTQKEGQETSIEREIQNINVSRTLNFVFRQMNQAFISFIHLTDVRIGFFNGLRESRTEVPLSDLQSLLTSVVDPAHHEDVSKAILDQLSHIRSHDGTAKSVVETTIVGPDDTFVSFDTELEDRFTDPENGAEYKLPGVILAVNRYAMRTEGVIVESILGEGDALDTYAQSLQANEVARRQAEARSLTADAERAELTNRIVSDNDASRASILEKVICPCGRYYRSKCDHDDEN